MAHPHPAARRFVLFTLVAGLLATSIPLLAQVQQRAVFVSVTDKAGKPVQSVSPSDLVVREDRVAREVLSVTPATDPMQIALLVDNSQAADSFVRYIRDGLSAFITAMAADKNVEGKHQVALIGLASRPTIIKDYTTDAAALIKSTQSIFAMPGSGTYLLDGITETSGGLSKRTAPRPVFVAIVTNGPELSDRPYNVVLDALKKGGAALYIIKVGSPANSSRDRAIVSDQGTQASGGRYEEILTGTGLAPTLMQLADELTHQFKAIYARPQALIPPEIITVESAKPDLKVRGTPLRNEPESVRR